MNATYAPERGYQLAPPPRPRHPADTLTLAAIHTAINIAGLFVKYTVRRWGMPHLEDTAKRLAVELISRAVETTGIPEPHPRWTEVKDIHLVDIRIHRQARGLLIEVWDSDPPRHCQPRNPHKPYLDAHLLAVEKMSKRWACYRPPSGGKVIWAELTIPQPREDNEQLPQCTTRQSPQYETPVTPMRDKQLMQRVLDGLHRLDSPVFCDGWYPL